MSRIRSPFASLLLISVATAAMAAAAAVQKPALAPKHVETRPAGTMDAPESRLEGEAAMQDAAAAAVVAALTEQFGPRTVTVKLDSAEVGIASIRDRVISGHGRVQIGSGEEWLAFRFRTLYDTLDGSAAYPQVTLSGSGAERKLPTDPSLVAELDTRVAAELKREFAGQRARFRPERVDTMQTAGRYQRISAMGTVDFGPEGTTPATVDALYDTRTRQWLRVRYELGPGMLLDASTRVAGN